MENFHLELMLGNVATGEDGKMEGYLPLPLSDNTSQQLPKDDQCSGQPWSLGDGRRSFLAGRACRGGRVVPVVRVFGVGRDIRPVLVAAAGPPAGATLGAAVSGQGTLSPPAGQGLAGARAKPERPPDTGGLVEVPLTCEPPSDAEGGAGVSAEPPSGTSGLAEIRLAPEAPSDVEGGAEVRFTREHPSDVGCPAAVRLAPEPPSDADGATEVCITLERPLGVQITGKVRATPASPRSARGAKKAGGKSGRAQSAAGSAKVRVPSALASAGRARTGVVGECAASEKVAAGSRAGSARRGGRRAGRPRHGQASSSASAGGQLVQYMTDVINKRKQMQQLEATYQELTKKVQFRCAHPDWGADPLPDVSAPAGRLVTLREPRPARDDHLAPVEPMSLDTLLPLSPEQAWRAVSELRLRTLDLQVALLYSKIQVKYRELRLQEAAAEHRRFRTELRHQQRESQRCDASRELRIRQLERRCGVAGAAHSEWRPSARDADKNGAKKKRRGELLAKRLDTMFTPMQMRVIRTGKTPRWGEEDIRRAIELKKLVSRRGYAYIRRVMRIPLPSPKIMRCGSLRFASLRPIYEQMVAANILKFATKKRPRVEVKREARAPVADLLTVGEGGDPTLQRPSKRSKKAPLVGLEVELAALAAVDGQTLVSDVASDAKATPSRVNWDGMRLLWDDGGQATLGDQLPADTLPRREPRQAWHAQPAGFL